MLRFFRQIRQRLLSESKFSKYLLYAVGEILLVVIGILIALQIDTWNNERNQHKLEIKSLKELRSDLQQSYNDIEADRNYFQSCTNSSQIILDVLENRKPYVDSLSGHFGGLFPSGATFSINQSTFENMRQTGESLIGNDSLRIHVTNFYTSWVNLYKEIQNRFLVLHYENLVKPAFLSRFQFVDRWKMIPRNYILLLDDQEFEQLIRFTAIQMAGVIQVQRSMMNEIESIVDEIDIELNTLE